jgi:predicted acylesterase/phospholipase RssA
VLALPALLEDKMTVPETPQRPQGLWLALSGGGFRAALFHYGCFKRLKELGLLHQVCALSATSGGALAAALLVQSIGYTDRIDTDWEKFEAKLVAAATQGILGPIPIVLLLRCLVWLAMIGFGFAILFYIVGSGKAWRLLWLANWIAGIALLLWLIVFVWLRANKDKGELRARLAKLDGKYALPKITRLGTALDDWAIAFQPAEIRQFILHHRLFEQMPLGSLSVSWPVYLVAADLNTGREMVFSSNTVSDLSPAGAAALWYQRWRTISADGGMSRVTLDNLSDRISFRVGYDSRHIPISAAVAASSAYPPLFRPVVVHVDGELVGSMVDGGVVDNHAVNVAYQIARHLTVERKGSYLPTLSDMAQHLLAIDASAPVTLKGSGMTSRLRALFRLPDILHSLQVQSAMDDVHNVAHMSRISGSAIGLRVGLPRSCKFRNEEIAQRAARIRTHFDAFSKIECAVVAYLGYCWIEDWALAQLAGRSTPIPLREFETILPDRFSAGPLTENEIVAHLRYSHLRLGPVRWIARRLRGRRSG